MEEDLFGAEGESLVRSGLNVGNLSTSWQSCQVRVMMNPGGKVKGKLIKNCIPP